MRAARLVIDEAGAEEVAPAGIDDEAIAGAASDMGMRTDETRKDELAADVDDRRGGVGERSTDMLDGVTRIDDVASLEHAMFAILEADDGAPTKNRCRHPRNASPRRRSKSTATRSATETMKSTTAAAVTVGLMLSRTPLQIWRGS